MTSSLSKRLVVQVPARTLGLLTRGAFDVHSACLSRREALHRPHHALRPRPGTTPSLVRLPLSRRKPSAHYAGPARVQRRLNMPQRLPWRFLRRGALALASASQPAVVTNDPDFTTVTRCKGSHVSHVFHWFMFMHTKTMYNSSAARFVIYTSFVDVSFAYLYDCLVHRFLVIRD